MKVFVTRNIPSVGLEKIKKAGHEVVISNKDSELSKEELINYLKVENPDAVISLLTDKIDNDVFEAMPKCKIVANYAVGFDNINLEEAGNNDVVVTNTPGVLTEAVAEHTVALILAIARKIVESDHFLRKGRYKGWDPMLLLGVELKGKTLGIVGCGRIGQRVAEIMHHGFGMNISYYDQKRNESFETELTANFIPDSNDLLRESDIVSIHLPATPETKHLINKETLSYMKTNALLVNTARGTIVNEVDLADALRQKTIDGAALDVFENEPDVHPDLLDLPNVILTPHTASATKEARDMMSVLVADDVIAVLNGEDPINPVM